MLDENDSTTTPETDPQNDRLAGSRNDGLATPGDAAPVVDPAAPPAPESDQVPVPAKKSARKSSRRPAKKTVPAAVDPFSPVPDRPVGDQPATENSGPTPDPSAPDVSVRDAGAPQAGAPEPGAADAGAPQAEPAAKAPARKSAAKKTGAKKATAKKTTAKRAGKKTATSAVPDAEAASAPAADDSEVDPTLPELVIGSDSQTSLVDATEAHSQADTAADTETVVEPDTGSQQATAAPSVLFQAPDPAAKTTRRRRSATKRSQPAPDDESPDPTSDTTTSDPTTPDDAAGVDLTGTDSAEDADQPDDTEPVTDPAEDSTEDQDGDDAQDREGGEGSGGNRRRRRRGGRRRRKSSGEDDSSDDGAQDGQASPEEAADGSESRGARDDGRTGRAGGAGTTDAAGDDSSGDGSGDGTASRRRRRRRRSGDDGDGNGNGNGNGGSDDPQNTVTRVRKTRNAEDEITSLHGSTRLEAKKQRRREGREAGRRRAPIVSEAEFLARREAVDRVMVIRQQADLTQIAVLEDKVLVEHYVARESQTSLIGNVYLGRVQNVLPSMEAAFVDIGKGRNAVLYAGEVNWDALGAGNGPRKIEQVLKSGQPILVQVSKDPIGHKGARLTAQVSLPGRFLVYVPDGTTSGISRKLPDNERSRLKTLLKEMVPESAGVIVRTAAEGASEEELTHDVERLTSRWADIESKVGKGNAPQLLYGEPDLTLKVVRDLFTEDFGRLVVSGDAAWDMVEGYVQQVAPDLEERLERHTGDDDVFAHFRLDEQIAKGLDSKVWLPSGGSLIIDRTEAMTVVDVNTGKFTGSGGNLEETVTKNNLEAAEEIVRQLRLRDIGGIIVVDFIDMVLESNRDLVLRRLVECLGRDRTRHQVAEVTSLGLVQMTRKRIGTGLLEAFSETCQHCQGRGLLVQHEPVEAKRHQDEEPRRGRRGRNRGDVEGSGTSAPANPVVPRAPSPADLAAMAKHEPRPVAPEATEDAVDTAPDVTAPLAPESVPDPVPDVASGSALEPAPEIVDPEPSDEAGSATAEVPEPEPVPAVVEQVEEQPIEQPTDQPVDEPTDQPEAPSAPVAPRVVTSSRRRVARRPAGPPVGAVTVPDAAESTDSA